MNARRLERQSEHQFRSAEFRSRQYCLVASAAWCIALFIACDYWLFVALAALMLQTATDEARRYRRTGCRFQTRRSIWKGTTAIDAAQRPLLGGWQYPFAQSPERKRI